MPTLTPAAESLGRVNLSKNATSRGLSYLVGRNANPVPGSMKNGEMLVGMGMASATFPVFASPASAKARIFANPPLTPPLKGGGPENLSLKGGGPENLSLKGGGPENLSLKGVEAVVQSGTHDIGTGTYTIMTQVAAEALGLDSSLVRFELGDTNLPKAPLTGGSMTTGSVGPAVKGAALALRNKAIKLAVEDARSPLYQCPETEIAVNNGRLFFIPDPTKGETYQELLTRHGLDSLEASYETERNAKAQEYGMHSFGSCFAEVEVDPLLGEIRVTRVVGVYGAGRILNPKTARSQMIGGIVWGLGMALMEHTIMDPNFGRIVNANFSDYLVPVHTDIPDMQIKFIPEEDPHVNALGTKGIGELSVIGVAAAIANAVYHATGKRIRDLPMTPDKLLS
jgi:xanthine dehydrogenase YagR molybdenum-binding subunit